MNATISVDKMQLMKAYKTAEVLYKTLQYMVAELGCLHENAVDLSTFGTIPRRYCPDCGVTFEVEE